MPVALVKAVLMSSTAFFIEAAAKAVSVTWARASWACASWARAGRVASVAAKARVARKKALLNIAVPRAKRGRVFRERVPEPPFRSTLAGAQRAASWDQISNPSLSAQASERKAV